MSKLGKSIVKELGYFWSAVKELGYFGSTVILWTFGIVATFAAPAAVAIELWGLSTNLAYAIGMVSAIICYMIVGVWRDMRGEGGF